MFRRESSRDGRSGRSRKAQVLLEICRMIIRDLCMSKCEKGEAEKKKRYYKGKEKKAKEVKK